jgi:signal transduction histidine kinase
MEENVDADLTHESLLHDLGNVFETIGEAAELLSSDKHWKQLAATITRSVARGKRLLGAIPDRAPELATVVEGAIQSVTDYCIAARKPRLRLTKVVPANIHLPGSGKDWERVFVNLFLNAAQVMHRPGRIDIETRKVWRLLSRTTGLAFLLKFCHASFVRMSPQSLAVLRAPALDCISSRPL